MESSAFLDGLNQHGYAFQYRVLQEALNAPPGPHGGLPWGIFGVETPVPGAKIDFVLQNPLPPHAVRLVVAECKRVNPAFSRWCFARSPVSRPERRPKVLETLRRQEASSGDGQLHSELRFDYATRGYDIGFVIKSNGRGDTHPVSRDQDAIEVACTQVLRGMNGLISALTNDPAYGRFMEWKQVATLIPVIFTTATLSTADCDLSQTDLDTGELHVPLEEEEVDWLYYQYSQSRQLMHSLPSLTPAGTEFEDLVTLSFVRSIAIVRPKGIRAFLAAAAGR